MRILAGRISKELKAAKHCAVYEAELMGVWPHNGVRREAKIAAFAKRHGWRLRYYASLAGQTSNFISLIQTDQFGLSDLYWCSEIRKYAVLPVVDGEAGSSRLAADLTGYIQDLCEEAVALRLYMITAALRALASRFTAKKDTTSSRGISRSISKSVRTAP